MYLHALLYKHFETARSNAIVATRLMLVDGIMPGLISLILGCGVIHNGVRKVMVAENGVALAKPIDLAIPYSIHDVSIALCSYLALISILVGGGTSMYKPPKPQAYPQLLYFII
jgi:hypothetical protein